MTYHSPIKSVVFLAVILLTAAGLMSQTGPKDLEHTRWRLVEKKGDQATLPSGIRFTLTLERSSYQFSGCNLMSGELRIEGQTLIFTGPAPSTRKACTATAEAVDVSFVRLAGGTPRYRIENDRLTLQAENGVGWVFQKEPLASKDAKTKFIYVSAFTKDCTGLVPTKCLQVRESKDKPWSLEYSGIVGFEYVPGIEYYLRIKEDSVAHPLPDAPSLVWYLDAVIKQSVVDRKAADEYLSSQKH